MRLTAESKERLDRFLSRSLPEHSRTKLARWIEDGEVRVGDQVVVRPSHELRPGDEVELVRPPESPVHDLTPVEIALTIAYEDADLLVVEKPRGLATHPAATSRAPSLVNALLARSHDLSQAGGAFRPGIVHRLDKDTTGLIVVAKNDAAHVALSRQIQAKTADRRYVALVGGEPGQERFSIEAPIGRDPTRPTRRAVRADGKPALTHALRIGQAGPGWLLALRLSTGRTHQIRVHLAACGLPVLGDPLYAPASLASGPLQLHAALLSFDHPTTGERVTLYSAPPADFLATVERAMVEGWE